MTPDLPDFQSLVVSRDVLPYDDLSISPGYDRSLLLPDDVPPVLALPWALGPNVPRVNRCQDDGALNVYQVNASGGAAGLSINAVQQAVEFDLYGQRPGDSQASRFFTQENCVILSLDLFWHWNDLTYNTGATHEHELRLATNSGSGDIRLAAVNMVAAGATNYPPTGNVQKTIVYPGGLALAPALQVGSDNQYLMYTKGTTGVLLGVLVSMLLGKSA